MIFALRTVLLLVLLAGGGGVLAWRVLRLRDVLSIVGLGPAIGTSFLLVVGNALAYAFSVPVAAVSTASLLLTVSVLSFLLPADTWTLPRRGLLWSIVAISLVAGFALARTSGSDPWAWLYFPLARTIVDGNFPVMELTHPNVALSYHYGPALFAAFWSILTGSTVAAGYTVQAFLGAWILVFCAAALSHSLHASSRSIVLSVLLLFFGAGFTWLHGWALLRDVLTQSPNPLEQFVPTINGVLGGSFFHTFPHRSFTLGAPLLMAFVLLFRPPLPSGLRPAGLKLVGLLFLLSLALIIESTFVLLYPAVIATAALMILPGEKRCRDARRAFHLVILFLLAWVFARLQGGVLSTVGTGFNASSFSLDPNPVLTYTTMGDKLALWDWTMLRDLLLPIAVALPPAVAFAWKRRDVPVIAFLLILALGHLAVPFLIHFETIQGDQKRLFFVAMPLILYVWGLGVGEWMEHGSRVRRVAVVFMSVAFLLCGTLLLAARTVLPTLRIERTPLFAGLPDATDDQRQLYDWVERHTTQKDWFYQYAEVLPSEAYKDETAFAANRIRFMTYTGRFSVGPLYMWPYPKDWTDQMIRFEKHCDAADARELRITHLVIDSPERATWFAQTCAPSQWSVAYATPSGTLRVLVPR